MRNMTNFDIFKALRPEQLAYILYDRNSWPIFCTNAAATGTSSQRH